MKKKISEFQFEYIIIVVFVIMSITICPHHSFNFDEFYTLSWCRISWSDFLYEVFHDTSPFLYYFMIRPIAVLTGQNIFIARLFSIIAFLIVLIIGATFVKKHFGKKAMFFYLVIIYMNPFMMQKSTEIRMYIWATAFTLLSGVYNYKLLTNPTRKDWIKFTVFSLLAAYTHYYAVLTMVFLYLGLLLFYLITRQKREIKNWFICSITTVISYLPFLLIAIFQIKESNGGWIPTPSSRLAPLKELFYSEFNGSEYLYLAIMVSFTIFAFIAFLRKKAPEFYWSLVCCSAIWGITAFGIIFGQLIKPILLSRYLIIPVCLLFLGIAPLVKYVNRYILLALCIPIVIIGGSRYQSTLVSVQADQTIDTLNFAEEHIMENDKIVLISGDDYLYNCTYYFIPQAELYYAGTFNADLFKKENDDDEFWFFDNGNYMNQAVLKEKGLTVDEFGKYQFGYMNIDIYKIH